MSSAKAVVDRIKQDAVQSQRLNGAQGYRYLPLAHTSRSETIDLFFPDACLRPAPMLVIATAADGADVECGRRKVRQPSGRRRLGESR